MSCMGFEPTFPVFERAETHQALDRAATVIGFTALHKRNQGIDINKVKISL
jgi:hypothetical protein